MDIKRFINRICFYALGLFFLALGVSISVNSNLGVSPVNSLPYVVSLITGVKMGTCVIAVFTVFILVQIIILRKEFKWINLTQILFSTLFGYFVNFTKMIIGDFALPGYVGRLAMLAVSIVLIAIGVSMYVNTKLVNMPMEGMTMAVTSKLKGKSFHQVKVVMDCIVVVIGVALSFIFLGGLQGIREGTVLGALLVGQVMKPVQKVLTPFMSRFCFAQEEGAI